MRLASGDVSAFEAVFRQYYPRVRAFALGLTKEASDADDIAQQVFVKLWTHRSQLVTVRNLDAYLFKTARNTFLDYIRSRKKNLVIERIDDGMCLPDSASPFEDLEREELRLLVDMVVETMPPKRQAVYRMIREQGLSLEEVSKTMSISKKTAENHLNLALRQLRKIVYLFLLIVNNLGEF